MSAEHFAPVDLLESRLATLEEPGEALALDGTRPVAELVTVVERIPGVQGEQTREAPY